MGLSFNTQKAPLAAQALGSGIVEDPSGIKDKNKKADLKADKKIPLGSTEAKPKQVAVPPPQPKNLERAEIIRRTNLTGDLGQKINRQLAEATYERGKQVYEKSNLTPNQKEIIRQSTFASPLAHYKGLKDLKKVFEFIDEMDGNIEKDDKTDDKSGSSFIT